MTDATNLAKTFSDAAKPLVAAMIYEFESKHPDACAEIERAVKLGERLRLSFTASGAKFEIDLACVNDYGDARKIASIKGELPRGN